MCGWSVRCPPPASQISLNFVRCPHLSLNVWPDMLTWNVRCPSPPPHCKHLSILCGLPLLLFKHFSCQSSSILNLYPRVWHSQLSLFLFGLFPEVKFLYYNLFFRKLYCRLAQYLARPCLPSAHRAGPRYVSLSTGQEMLCTQRYEFSMRHRGLPSMIWLWFIMTKQDYRVQLSSTFYTEQNVKCSSNLM